MPAGSEDGQFGGVEQVTLTVALDFRIPSFGQKEKPICRYILYYRKNKSLQRSIALQKGGPQGMIFCTAYTQVPLWKNPSYLRTQKSLNN
jgi:hypothetical protein